MNERELIPPPGAHGVTALGRSQPPNGRETERVTHHAIPTPEPNDGPQSTALLPYTQIGEGGTAMCRRRPMVLTPGENFQIKSQVSENVRRRAECTAQREARSLWMRLRYQTHEDPFDPTDGFIDDAVRLATLGRTYLEISEIMGNSLGIKASSSPRNAQTEDSARQPSLHAPMGWISRIICLIPNATT